MLNAVGLQNAGVEYFCRETLPKLPTNQTNVIANIYASSVEEFAELAAILEHEPRIKALEVNISCPNVRQGGVLFGQDAKMAAHVTKACRQAAPNKFLIVKLSPNVTDIAYIAQSVEGAGCDCISCINTLQGMSVDLKSRRPMLANVIGGLSGPAIKPVALRCVWQVAKAVKIPVIGVGGITSARDVLEFILVGAWAIQVGTANFMRPQISFELIKDIPLLCEELNITSLTELRGSLKVS